MQHHWHWPEFENKTMIVALQQKNERLLDQWFDKSLRSDIAENDDSLPAKAVPLIDAADGKWTREVLKETILWLHITDMSAQDQILFQQV